MKRRAVLLVLSVLVAAVGTGLIAVYVKGADDRAVAGQKLVSVLMAVKPIPKGTPADTLLTTNSGLVKKASIQTGAVPGDVVHSDIDEERLNALGTALIDIPAGQSLSDSFFSPTRGAGAAASNPDEKGFSEILVPLSGPQSASGLIRIGGPTTVLTTEKGQTGKTRVLIPSATVVSINGQDGDTATTRGVTGADSTVGLSVSIFNAQRIAWALDHDLTIYLVGQTDDADKAAPVVAADLTRAAP